MQSSKIIYPPINFPIIYKYNQKDQKIYIFKPLKKSEVKKK